MSETLPVKITRTEIWQRTLAPQEGDIDSSSREKLRSVFAKFRERAGMLAQEISRDLPEFTVHDITHADALWELADLIIGPEYPLTPAEAFVLGGAFLIHDLGMGLAAYPEGKEALYEKTIWKDTITYFLKEKLGHFPTKEEIDSPSKEVEDKTIGEVLRVLHAERAEELAFVEWKDESPNSTSYHLIEDPEIRNIYGSIIGKIAHSHWWPVKKLEEEFHTILGSPSIFPNEWSVDPLKISCILRVADASHLDSSRATGFLKALRMPSKYSSEHWKFQEKLNKPRVESDRFLFTSTNYFIVDDFNAWWLCHDTLCMIDRELREVDALLADKNKPRFCVKSVAGVEEPDRLEKLIQTKGWYPVDANIKVSNVSSLVYNLGGEQLYGRNDTVPLRELIQNSIDAIKARRIVEDRPEDWGDIIVRSGKDSEAYWIEVEDNGIGMSSEVLKGPFLDFGTSSWGSQLMRDEHPGLLAKGFRSIGRYGIGFFSVFMWGKRIQIITRRYDDAQQDTLVMEFDDGVESRPILRKAQRDEFLRDGGTRIRVWLQNHLRFYLQPNYSKELTLSEICSFIAPSIDVNLSAQADTLEPTKVISASDWITLKSSDLLSRILVFENEDNTLDKNLSTLGGNLKLLKNEDGNIVGRACISIDRDSMSKSGIITVGGLNSCNLNGIVGILAGEPTTASRNSSMPIVNKQELSRWATEQSEFVYKLYRNDEDLAKCVKIIRSLGGETGELPIAYSVEGWKNAQESYEWFKLHDEVILLQLDALTIESKKYKELKLKENVLAVSMTKPSVISGMGMGLWPITPDEYLSDDDWYFNKKTLRGLAIEICMKSWSVSLEELRSTSDFNMLFHQEEIGYVDGKAVILAAEILRNPNKTKKII